MPAFDLALSLWVVWRTPNMIHALAFKPFFGLYRTLWDGVVVGRAELELSYK